PGRVVLRNYEGYITTYDEPLDYDPHAIDHLDRQASERSEPGQVGVAGLLTGKIPFIKPEGFDDTHRRNGIQHRLNANDAKWQRFRMDQPDPGRKPADKPNGQNGKRNGNGAAKSNGNGRNKAKPARNGARTADGAEQPVPAKATQLMRIAVLANLHTNAPTWEGMSPDQWADLDSPRTVEAIIRALEAGGHEATFLEASIRPPFSLIERLLEYKPD